MNNVLPLAKPNPMTLPDALADLAGSFRSVAGEPVDHDHYGARAFCDLAQRTHLLLKEAAHAGGSDRETLLASDRAHGIAMSLSAVAATLDRADFPDSALHDLICRALTVIPERRVRPEPQPLADAQAGD